MTLCFDPFLPTIRHRVPKDQICSVSRRAHGFASRSSELNHKNRLKWANEIIKLFIVSKRLRINIILDFREFCVT